MCCRHRVGGLHSPNWRRWLAPIWWADPLGRGARQNRAAAEPAALCVSVVGRADDTIAPHPSRLGAPVSRGLVAGSPLVERTTAGWVSLHPLWAPPLRRLMASDDADEARRSASSMVKRRRFLQRSICCVKRGPGRSCWKSCWPGSCPTQAVASTTSRHCSGPAVPGIRRAPPGLAALLAHGFDLLARGALGRCAAVRRSGSGLREVGDVEAEVAVIRNEGLIRWWPTTSPGSWACTSVRWSSPLPVQSPQRSWWRSVTEPLLIFGRKHHGTLTALAGVDLDSLAAGQRRSLGYATSHIAVEPTLVARELWN